MGYSPISKPSLNPANLGNIRGGFARQVPRPQDMSSAAKYALGSIVTPILDGHPAGRAFNVAGRAILHSIPPQARVGFPGFNFGSWGNSFGNYAGSSPRPIHRELAHADGVEDDGTSLSASATEEGEEEIAELKKLIEEEESLKKGIEDLRTKQDELNDSDLPKGDKVQDQINQLEAKKQELRDKIDEAIKQLKGHAKDKDGQDLTEDEIYERIKNGDLANVNIYKLPPEKRKELRKILELGTSVDEEPKSQGSTLVQASLNGSGSAYDPSLYPWELAEQRFNPFA